MTGIFVYEYVSGGAPMHDDAATASLLHAGIAMRDAMVLDLLALPDVWVTCAVSSRAGPPCPAHRRLICVAPQAHEPPEDFVHRLTRGHDHAWVVAPETHGALARLHEAVGETRWIGCTAEAIRTASSKRATVAALSAAGVPTPIAVAPEASSRWIVKPDDGAGAVDTRIHPHRDSALADLQERERHGRATTMEPYVEGKALSVSLLAGAPAPEVIALNRQQIAVDAHGRVADLGVLHHAIGPEDPRAACLRAVAADVVRALPGLRGYVGIDLVWHATRGPVVIEVNPRLTCAYPGLSAKLGRNLAADILALHAIKEMRDAA
jgi:predicted ATP-grasp superfamily ATP-dependent carboligase